MAKNFVDDDHAVMTGFLLGTLMKAGIPVFPVQDSDGNYSPRLVVMVDAGHAEPTQLHIEVLW